MGKNIAILGSTGSIGTQTLEVVRQNPDVKVCALAAGKNIELLEQQIREFMPELAVVWEEKDAKTLKERTADLDVKIHWGMDGLNEVAVFEGTDILVSGIVGMIGIEPTINALKAGKDIALANKETLVTAGHIIMPLAKKLGRRILPVDSEHSAIFQCLNGEKSEIDKILLTASGGPFRGMNYQQLEKVSLEDALKHPVWSMGQKITIDSASLVNKGLEIMEAGWLFNVPVDRVQVVIHPQCIIHSMVQFMDGAVMAQLGTPDMRLAIEYALFCPERRYLDGKRVDFASLGQITFEAPDPDTFRSIPLAYAAAKEGGSMPAVYNAANEAAVAKLLNREIGFTQIYEIIEYCMEHHDRIENPDVGQILDIQRQVERQIESRW